MGTHLSSVFLAAFKLLDLSDFSLVLYLISGIILLAAFRYLYQLKKTDTGYSLSHNPLKEKEENRQWELKPTERKTFQRKIEQLQKELERKNRELANNAMSVVLKNELLQKIQRELHELKDSDGRKLTPEQLRKIEKILNEAMRDEGDWNLFEKSFNEAHENFFKKLKVNHKDLVPNDLKLCAYLRMNMNSKEIASLLSISLRGVEIRRYRLRKKLNVPHDKNLTEFLLEL